MDGGGVASDVTGMMPMRMALFLVGFAGALIGPQAVMAALLTLSAWHPANHAPRSRSRVRGSGLPPK